MTGMKTVTAQHILDELQRRCLETSQRDIARKLGFSAAFISDVLKGRRDVTENLAKALGFRVRIRYEHIQVIEAKP